MWGDSEGAYSLTSSDDLSKCLYQTTGPAHIPYNDSRWQQLLLHYDRLVHLHSATLSTHDDVVGTACAQCAKYSATSSNLAALTLHISRMLRDLQSDLEHYSNNSNEGGDGKHRITIIGKARATCGALNLLRLLSHETIVQACDSAKAQEQTNTTTTQDGANYYSEQPTAAGNDTSYLLKESFTYRSRQSSGSGDQENDAAVQIISSMMLFLSTVGKTTTTTTAATNTPEIISIPEIYDVIVQILSLLLVLLSTQLYQPMVSSAEAAESEIPHGNFFLDKFMEYSSWQRQNYRTQQKVDNGAINEPMAVLSSCLTWLVDRPAPPRRSIASHYVELTKAVAHQMTDLVLSNDGMYEDSCIVMAAAPKNEQNDASSSTSAVPLQTTSNDKTHNLTTVALGTDDSVALSSKGHVSGDVSSLKRRSIVLQPIRSILLLSSTVLLLPIRLVRLAFTVLGRKQHAILPGDVSKDDHSLFQQIQTNCEKSSWNKTNNILLLTDSPIADLSTALILLVTNNYRAQSVNGRNALRNPFRVELASLNDTRWGKDVATRQSDSSLLPLSSTVGDSQAMSLSINFESLFEAFGRICHTELGALTLYTMLLSSPIFAESVAARSDLDLVIIPLLRSLYFSSVMKHDKLLQKKGAGGQKTPFQLLSQTDKPYRSQSQLYVILILLLIFSQDPSFGRDSFRRVSIPAVQWYKERQIKAISLGSMILVVLLRVITFNLNMLHDEFLLSNCIAVLLNLSPHIVQLHKYVATRITFVTISCFKRYLVLLAENGGIPEEEGDLSSPLGMHGEACRTFLQLIKHSVRPRCVEDNLHLVYALLVEQRDIQKICQHASMKQGDLAPIIDLIQRANNIIEQHGTGRSAAEAMQTLKLHSAELKSDTGDNRGRTSSSDSVTSEATDLGNLTFTYEEEADPEVFFVPYLWDVIVGALTTSTLEWSREKILVFPLNEDTETLPHDNGTNNAVEKTEFDNTPDVV
mmetsp:Transcript_26809/g.53604  ORF Transcript_26809/g.53604 Transcript_26809/m.53604 type:complete len:978 (+) Transcript_26809:99-3032(+)